MSLDTSGGFIDIDEYLSRAATRSDKKVKPRKIKGNKIEKKPKEKAKTHPLYSIKWINLRCMPQMKDTANKKPASSDIEAWGWKNIKFDNEKGDCIVFEIIVNGKTKYAIKSKCDECKAAKMKFLSGEDMEKIKKIREEMKKKAEAALKSK